MHSNQRNLWQVWGVLPSTKDDLVLGRKSKNNGPPPITVFRTIKNRCNDFMPYIRRMKIIDVGWIVGEFESLRLWRRLTHCKENKRKEKRKKDRKVKNIIPCWNSAKFNIKYTKNQWTQTKNKKYSYQTKTVNKK